MRPGFAKFTYPVGKYGSIVLSKDEEEIAYNQCLVDVIENPRYYLNNLHSIKEFQVSWLYYGSRANCARVKRFYATSHPKPSPFKNESSVNIKEC